MLDAGHRRCCIRGVGPKRKKATILQAIAISNFQEEYILVAMASNLEAMASDPIAMASNLEAMDVA